MQNSLFLFKQTPQIPTQTCLEFKLQCPILSFGFLCWLWAFSQLQTFWLAIVTTHYRKQNVLRLHFGDLNFPDLISITFMYAVAASPLAKQTGTRVGAGEMNTENRQKQIRWQYSLWLKTVLEQGSVIAWEIPSRWEHQGANNNPRYKHENNHSLKFSSEKHGRQRSVPREEMTVLYCCGVWVVLGLSSIAAVTSGAPWTDDMDQCWESSGGWLGHRADHITCVKTC